MAKREQVLVISTSGGDFVVNKRGEIQQYNYFMEGGKFSGQWLLLGLSKGFSSTAFEDRITFVEAWKHLSKSGASSFKNLHVWDNDHGTLRRWGNKARVVYRTYVERGRYV